MKFNGDIIRILITGACGVTSRSVARALKKSFFFEATDLIGTDICHNIYGLYEGLFSKIYKTPHAGMPDYLSNIEDIYHKENIDAAIVIPEPEVLIWSEKLGKLNALLPPPKFCKYSISKSRLFKLLAPFGLVPQSITIIREEAIEASWHHGLEYPVWIRDVGEGTTSGRGSFLAKSRYEEILWLNLYSNAKDFQFSEYLPGRNIACCMLYYNGNLIRSVCAERISYFMSHLVPSGVSGNTCEGTIFIDNDIVEKCNKAVQILIENTGEVMNGLVTVDLKGNIKGELFITEINLRHVAFTSMFAEAGHNMAEAQLLASLNRISEIPLETATIPETNRFYRDIDGMPVYVKYPLNMSIGDINVRTIKRE